MSAIPASPHVGTETAARAVAHEICAWPSIRSTENANELRIKCGRSILPSVYERLPKPVSATAQSAHRESSPAVVHDRRAGSLERIAEHKC